MFFILRIQKNNDGTFTKSVYEADTQASALQRYYSTLSGDVGNAALSANLCMLLTETGNVVESRYFDHASENE